MRVLIDNFPSIFSLLRYPRFSRFSTFISQRYFRSLRMNGLLREISHPNVFTSFFSTPPLSRRSRSWLRWMETTKEKSLWDADRASCLFSKLCFPWKSIGLNRIPIMTSYPILFKPFGCFLARRGSQGRKLPLTLACNWFHVNHMLTVSFHRGGKTRVLHIFPVWNPVRHLSGEEFRPIRVTHSVNPQKDAAKEGGGEYPAWQN